MYKCFYAQCSILLKNFYLSSSLTIHFTVQAKHLYFFLSGFHHLASAYLGFVPDHWCNFDHISFPSHWTESEKKNYSIPVEEDGTFSKCQMFDITSSLSSQYDTAMRERTRKSYS